MNWLSVSESVFPADSLTHRSPGSSYCPSVGLSFLICEMGCYEQGIKSLMYAHIAAKMVLGSL